jgi:hypothetical protein
MTTEKLHTIPINELYDPALAWHLEDFIGGIVYFQKNPKLPPNENKAAAELLCELSRDVLFRVGCVADAGEVTGCPDIVEQIANLFFRAADLIDPMGDELVGKYKEHIRIRGERLLAELSDAKASAGDAAPADTANA